MPQMPFFMGRPDPNKPTQWTPEDQRTPHPVGDTMLSISGALRGLAGLGDDSQASRFGELVGTAAPILKGLGMAAPLISIFKDASGVPSTALREAGTEAFKQRAVHWPGEMAGAAEEFAQKYPRIAAHIRPSYAEAPAETPNALGVALPPYGQVREPVEVRLTPRGDESLYTAKSPELAQARARNIMSHEGAHVAQALGNKDFAGLYQDASKMVGYEANPFEWSANRSGSSAMGIPTSESMPTAIQQLKALSSHPSEEGRAIQAILERRANTPMKPATVSTQKPGWDLDALIAAAGGK
jgi:hypothetical protein